MTPRQAALAGLAVVRGVAPMLGFHPVSVLLRTRTRSSGKIQTGPATTADLVIGHPSPTSGQILPPHIKGEHTDAEITVGPLTPFDAVASPRGYTRAQLLPSDAAGVEYYYLVTWEGGLQRRYLVAPRGLDTTDPLGWRVKLQVIDRPMSF
jgi:hypothetical protein